MRLAEEKKIVLMASAFDYAGGATNSTDSINMKNFHRVTFLIDIGTMGGGDAVFYIYSGASAGTETTAETFSYAFGAATAIFGGYVANHDVLAATATSAALTITQATYPNFLLVVDLDASAMTDGQPWLTIDIKDAGGNPTGLASIFAVLEPRYTSDRSLTALT